MAWDNDRLVRRELERSIRQANRAIDTAAGGIIDKRIVAVPPDIPERHHVGFGEVDRKVAVRMARAKAFDHDGLTIELEGLICVDDDGRTAGGRRRLKGIVPVFYRRHR